MQFQTRVEYVYLDIGCDGQPNSGKTNDNCGVCGGNSSSCIDCRGVPNGNAIRDNCNVCRDDFVDLCAADCAGVWGGDATVDDCNICGGDNSCVDCAGQPNGGATVDHCDDCGIPAVHCAMDCAGEWGGSGILDACSICNGDGSKCATVPFRWRIPVASCADAATEEGYREQLMNHYLSLSDTSQVSFPGSCSDGILAQDRIWTLEMLLPVSNPAPSNEELGVVLGLDFTDAQLITLAYDCFGELRDPSLGAIPVIDACGSCGGSNACADCAGDSQSGRQSFRVRFKRTHFRQLKKANQGCVSVCRSGKWKCSA